MQSVAISATEAKNEFGRILERVIQGAKVVITKHDSPKAVLISMDEFNALSNAHTPSSKRSVRNSMVSSRECRHQQLAPT